MPPSPVEELALLELDRSNKGASKQRRDQINAEIAVMRDLLPLPETARQRLSQLQIMSLSCVYIRKCNILQKLFRSYSAEKDVPTMWDFFQALTGFLLITTREGKLVYISENVTDYLGHSMVDMKTQGDSLYDIVDKRDQGAVQAQLLKGGAEVDVTRDVAFFCRMNMSRTLKRQAGFGDVKVMHVRGHFIPLSDPDLDDPDHPQQQGQLKYVFMATCSPLITPELKETLIQSNTMIFKTVHGLDMSYMEVTKTAEYHLGFTTEELCQKSWYSMLHPEDIHEAREKHVLLIRSSHEMGCMMTVRMLTAQGAPLWVNTVLHVRQAASTQNDEPLIICINQVISEEEAYQIRMESHMFTLYPPRTGDLWAAGMPSTPAMPQQSQPEHHWMSAVAPTAPVNSSYQSPVASYYMGGQQQPQHSAMPACTSTNMTYQPDTSFLHHHHHHHHQLNSSSSSPASSTSSASPPTVMLPLSPHGGQTQDKLKLMLKRKLQGPCRPAKIPKLIWDEHQDGGLEYAATDTMHNPDSASHFNMNVSSSSSGGLAYGWSAGPSAQMVSLAQYRTAHVMPMQHRVKSSLLPQASDFPAAALSPPLSISSTSSLLEQVVPDSVVLPESYLTPDPSPASSPQPHSLVATAAVKAEVVVSTRAVPTSAAILKELEKLASLNQTDSTAAVGVNSVKLPKTIKTEQMTPDCQQKPARKELPIMDAFDIESFFDMLSDPVLDTKRQELVSSLKVSQTGAVKNICKVLKQQMLPIKQEPVDTEVTFPQVQPQPQPQPQPQDHYLQPRVAVKKAEDTRPQPSQMNQHEMEELLSFFSGDMTATQMDLNEAFVASDVKDEGDLLVESAEYFGQKHLSCSMGGFISGWERPMEELSPSSSSSEMSSDLSGDEDSRCCEEPMKGFLTHAVKHEERRNLSFCPAPFILSTQPMAQTPTPQAVPGITEEDELYQLDKLLSSMASDSGILLSEETQ